MSQHGDGNIDSRRSSARNPRRRQRLDTDSIGHQPQRKRSKVSSETFEGGVLSNGDPLQRAVVRVSSQSRRGRSATPGDFTDVPYRSRRTGQERSARTHSGTVFASNAHYTLRQLNSTPDAIRSSTDDFRCSTLPSPPLALAVSTTHAFIWDWSSATPVNQPRTFEIPEHSRSSGRLPLGQLVLDESHSSTGLILISTTGQITFWENIDTAESLSLFRDRGTGSKSATAALFPGEQVVDLVAARPTEHILTTNSGRMALIALRDAQGRACLQCTFLSSQEGLASNGIFSSLKGALGIGWRNDLIGVKVRTLGSKGQTQVISATSNAVVQIWDLSWSGQCSRRGTIEFHELLQKEIQASLGVSPKHVMASLVDFAILPAKTSGSELTVVGEDGSLDLVFLARHGDDFALLEVTVASHKAYVERVTVLRNVRPIASQAVRGPMRKPLLLIPEPTHSAVVVFHDAVAVVALADIDPTEPDAQLLLEAHRSPRLFQDVIYLRNEEQYSILDAQVDASDPNNAACLLFVRSAGVARLSVDHPSTEGSSVLPIKSRIAQAVVHGHQHDNFLNFQRFSTQEYTLEDAEDAALQISQAILSSSLELPSLSHTSIEGQITQREQACLAIIGYLRRHFGSVSRSTCWKLLADAEKLAAGLKLWKSFDKAMSDPDTPRPTVLPAVIKVVRSKTRGTTVSKESETDEVRHWFLHDLTHIDQVCLQALSLVNNGCESGALHNLTRLLSECDDILFSVYDTVYQFRADHADVYGINPANISDGVLEESWEDLPEPWTATHEGLNLYDRFIDLARNYMVDLYEKPEQTPEVDDMYVNKVILENVSLVHILCRCYRERIAWCSAHYMEKFRNYAPGLQEKFKRSREHHLRGLVKIGQAGAGLKIAEKFKDMDTLVRLVMSETAYLVESKEDPTVPAEERMIISERMDDLQNAIRRYFKEYGTSFANPFFDNHLAGHRSFGLLNESSIFTKPLTEYLRAEPSRGCLGWINEVLNASSLDRGQVALQRLAKEHETKLWNKKVELSLAKLALCATETKQTLDDDTEDMARKFNVLDSELTLVAIQEAINVHIRPTILAAVDHDAEVQLVSDAYAVSIRASLPALHQLLEITFDDLLRHVALSGEQLIDLLTLMDSVPSAEPESDIAGKEMYLALRVLDAIKGDVSPGKLENLQRTIWKRCYLRDDWALINKTGLRSEASVQQRLRETTTAGTIALALVDVLAPGSALSIVKPQECIGGSSGAEDLRIRFPTSDIRDPILQDNLRQDTQLRDVIDKHDLGKWVNAAVTEAKSMAEEEADLQLAAAQGQTAASTTNGHVNGTGSETGSTAQHDGVDGNDAMLAGEIMNPDVVTVMDMDGPLASMEGSTLQTTAARIPRKSKTNGIANKGKTETAHTDEPTTQGRKSQRLLRSQLKEAENDVEMT